MGLPWWSSVTTALPLQGAGLRSLVAELRSPCQLVWAVNKWGMKMRVSVARTLPVTCDPPGTWSWLSTPCGLTGAVLITWGRPPLSDVGSSTEISSWGDSPLAVGSPICWDIPRGIRAALGHRSPSVSQSLEPASTRDIHKPATLPVSKLLPLLSFRDRFPWPYPLTSLDGLVSVPLDQDVEPFEKNPLAPLNLSHLQLQAITDHISVSIILPLSECHLKKITCM